jgi:predicted nucleic acid-binding protein
VDATREFLGDNEGRSFFSPALALFEVYRGGSRTGGEAGRERVASALDWVQPLPLTEPCAGEAALVESELLERGHPINLGDVLVAGVCRHHGADIVTRDDQFERIDDLAVLEY